MKLKEKIKLIDERRTRLDHILNLIEVAKSNEIYSIAVQEVDKMFDSSYYESGTIIAISPTREGFDDLHENYRDLYRGGYEEIKVGNDYIIYGFEFD